MSTKKVLMIDDEKEFCDLVKLYLERKGVFEVETLTDSREAMRVAKAFQPDVIITDLRMPHIGGFELMELLNNDADTQNIPVIVSSALADKADIKKAYYLGANGYVVKPVELSALETEINRVLGE
ncbi:MAG: response regulator [Candidatus Omnitrophica bacterium]|nr:response regulator [Candidatus Omnitrophota bacterium]